MVDTWILLDTWIILPLIQKVQIFSKIPSHDSAQGFHHPYFHCWRVWFLYFSEVSPLTYLSFQEPGAHLSWAICVGSCKAENKMLVKLLSFLEHAILFQTHVIVVRIQFLADVGLRSLFPGWLWAVTTLSS